MAEEPRIEHDKQTRTTLVVVACLLSAVGLYIRFVYLERLDASAALYVGLPLLLVIGLIFTPRSVSATGAGLKGLTILLLLSVPILNEGFLCILMASPLLYGIVAAGGAMTDRSRRKERERQTFKLAVFTALLGILALEGTHDLTTMNRMNTVTVTRLVDADPAAVRAQLAKPPAFDNVPALGWLFPMPDDTSGRGLAVGDTRALHYTYNKWIVANAHTGTTIYEVTESRDDLIHFAVKHDDSYISHYLTWHGSSVAMQPMGDQTQVTWTLQYERKLDPIWYFGPMQRFVVNRAAHSLIDNLATPGV